MEPGNIDPFSEGSHTVIRSVSMSQRFLLTLVTVIACVGLISAACSQVPGGAQAPAKQEASNNGIPRTPDGHPDFTGVFNVHGVENITDNLAPGSEIVHTPYGEELHKKVDAALDPNARCLPWGPTRMMCCTVMPDAFIQHKDIIAILTESQQTFRLVYLDGRPVPDDIFDKDGNYDPQVGGWMGFSRGHWDGDKLVVETVGAEPRTWVDGQGGHLHIEKMKLTEVFELKDPDTISYMATIDDPVMYQKPWSFVKTYNRVPKGDRILSHSCVENEKDFAYMKPGAIVGGEPGRAGRAGRGGRGETGERD